MGAIILWMHYNILFYAFVGTCVAIRPIFPYMFAGRLRIMKTKVAPNVALDDDVFYKLFFLFVV